MSLPNSPIALNEEWNGHLSDLQCHILKHHGRLHAWHIFFEFRDGQIDNIKSWLIELSEELKNAKEQLGEADLYREALANGRKFDGGVIETISFTNTGLDLLGLKDKLNIDGDAFKDGMRARRKVLDDDDSQFDSGFLQILHGMLMIADDKISRGKNRLNKRIQQLEGFSKVHLVQKGRLEERGSHGVEHFGYADGISQPLFLTSEIDKQNTNKNWSDKADAATLLVMAKDGKKVAGSYLVFRKLEQNVKGFKESVKRMQEPGPLHCPVLNVDGKINKELSVAMIVGRFEDGTPTILHSDAVGGQSNKMATNDFKYQTDEYCDVKCPLFSHIRLTNPRDGVDDNKERRIARRGIPYNDTGVRRRFSDTNEDTSQFKDKLGLLFMCYQSSIDNQFEHIQGLWANNGQIGNSNRGQDLLIGQGKLTSMENIQPELPVQWGKNGGKISVIGFKDFVTTKGGEYFFTPAISFLKF